MQNILLSNLERPWFQNTVLGTLLFIPSDATGIKTLGWGGKKKKKNKRKKTEAGLAKLTAHYVTMILFSFEPSIMHGQVFLLSIQCIRAVIAGLPYHLSS